MNSGDNLTNSFMFRNFVMVSARSSCLTLSLPSYCPYDAANEIMPSAVFQSEQKTDSSSYSLEYQPLSNDTYTYQNRDLMEDFVVIRAFAEKILQESLTVDDDIQRVINDHFWEMI